MSDAADAHKPKTAARRCANFEPQTWRKTLCKNCFKTKDEHGAAADDGGSSGAPSTTTSRETTPVPTPTTPGSSVAAKKDPVPDKRAVKDAAPSAEGTGSPVVQTSLKKKSTDADAKKASASAAAPQSSNNEAAKKGKECGVKTTPESDRKPSADAKGRQPVSGASSAADDRGVVRPQPVDPVPVVHQPGNAVGPGHPGVASSTQIGKAGAATGAPGRELPATAAAGSGATVGVTSSSCRGEKSDDIGKSEAVAPSAVINRSTSADSGGSESSARTGSEQKDAAPAPASTGAAAAAASSTPRKNDEVERAAGKEHKSSAPGAREDAPAAAAAAAAASEIVRVQPPADDSTVAAAEGRRDAGVDTAKVEDAPRVRHDQSGGGGGSAGEPSLFTKGDAIGVGAGTPVDGVNNEQGQSSSLGVDQTSHIIAELDSYLSERARRHPDGSDGGAAVSRPETLQPTTPDAAPSTGSGNRVRVEANLTLSNDDSLVNYVDDAGGVYVVSGSRNQRDASNSWHPTSPEDDAYGQNRRLPDYDQSRPVNETGSHGETLFHHVPEDDFVNGSPGSNWDLGSPGYSVGSRNEPDNRQQSPAGAAAAAAAAAASSRRRRRRIISVDDSDARSQMDGTMDLARSEAMMEGTRMLIDSLRDKVGMLEDRCEKMDREKLALSDLLVAKKSDYDRMKTHCHDRISDLEDEVQRLKSEKARLLDRLQLPESERASLAAEENEIAELKRRLEDYELRYGDALAENEELQQEVRDLQLAMAELHDQFRDEEMAELRELQRELEATAKACRISQFKLRKTERRCDQLDAERLQADEKIRSLENCLQGSDDKRRIRLLEEELRKAKEAAVRLHEDMETAEDRRQRHQDDLDRVKNQLNESENRRLCLQNQLDSAQTELHKLREQLKYEGRLDLLKPTATRYASPTPTSTSSDVAAAVAQLTRDLAASEERENDLREQLKFAEQENKTLRRKLADSDEEIESMNLQLRKLSGVSTRRSSSGSRSSPGGSSSSKEDASQREAELRLQMELAEQEVTVLRRKLEAVQNDNENLMTAVKYLRSKVEVPTLVVGGGAGRAEEELEACRKELDALRQQVARAAEAGGEVASSSSEGIREECERLRQQVRELERRNVELMQKLNAVGGGGGGHLVNGSGDGDNKDSSQIDTFRRREQELLTELGDVRKRINELASAEPQPTQLSLDDLQNKVQELEKSLSDERQKLETTISEHQKTEAELTKSKEDLQAQLKSYKTDLKKCNKELDTAKADLKKANDELKTVKDSKVKSDETQKELDAIKKKSVEVEEELKKCQSELKTANEFKVTAESLQKKFDELKQNYDKLVKESGEKSSKLSPGASPTGAKDKEPATWRWDKQELERQIKELKKKNDDLVAQTTGDAKKGVALKSIKQNDASGECTKCSQEKTELRTKLEQAQQERDAAVKEKESLSKVKDDGAAKPRPKFGSIGKDAELAEKTKTVQDLNAKLDKKEIELKTTKADKTKAEAEAKKAQEAADELRKRLDQTTADVAALKAEAETAKAKLVEQQEKATEERTRLEAELKQANEKLTTTKKSSKKKTSVVDDEREELVKEKQKLTDEVSKVKKELDEVERRAKSEKEELEKSLTEKTKLVETKTKAMEKLQAEIDALKTQSSSKSAGSAVVVVPVQQEKSAGSKSIPIQKSASKSTDAAADELERRFQAEKSSLEELYRSKMKTLEDQATRSKEQLDSFRKDSEKLASESKTALADIRTRYEKELEAWNKEREQLKKLSKQSDEYKSRISVLDKSVEELTSKLKSEEAKSKELETKLKLANSDAGNPVSTSSKAADKKKADEKPKPVVSAPEEKTSNPKLSDFRSKFEKFGGTTTSAPSTPVPKPGTPAPFRRNLAPPAAAADTSATAGKADGGAAGKDVLADLQKQLADAEKNRVKDRQELVEKMTVQKKELDAEINDIKKKNSKLEAKAEELSALQKDLLGLRCQIDEERSEWLTEKSRLQTDVDDALKERDDERIKAAELAAEIAKLRTSVAAGTPTPASNSASSGDSKTKSTTSKTPSVVIPIKRVDGKKASDDVTGSDTNDVNGSTPTTPEVPKPVRKFGAFSPVVAETGRVFGVGAPVKVATATPPRTIPITRVNRPGTPKI